MSARATDLQAQVESVLGALVKAATVELTKLFETRYGVSPLQVGVGRNEDKEKTETIITVDDISTADTKRSIGVQVENDIYAPLEASGPPLVLEEDSLRECGEEVGVQEGCRVSSKVLLYEANSYVDSDLSPLNEQVLSVDVVEVDVPDDFTTDSDAQTDIVFHVSAEAWTEVLALESTQKRAAKQQPIVIQPDTSNNTSDKVNFVCPLILKPESPVPKPDSSEKQFQTEPQQRCVSTSKGTAYSPSPSDGAITPAQVGVWERIHTPDGAKNNLHMRLKLSSADPKLMRQCTVQLVDVLKVSKPGKNLKDNVANCKSDVPLPKDLRRHQGLHTGHRICCFTSCGNHIWRLHKDVAHSRNRGTAAHLHPVRKGLPSARQPESTFKVSHRREAVQLCHMWEDVQNYEKS
ncbi:uncharacterized protein si:rp71-1g18.1 isoform X2 [Betta splendens]|uniref:Uncharacterized protein si:rp71-1g18.1 isoform X2 n=1 Tax=Betta splendens TaxID=158456 RepID=A0A6P7L2G3_BETSP|nr:uncharacterized protein si:rp71-1g18.1 isoform X2 [Betta splendens]